jgi:proline iminopeptidase
VEGTTTTSPSASSRAIPAIHMKAAQDWCAWEAASVSVDPEATPELRRLQPAFQLAFAR